MKPLLWMRVIRDLEPKPGPRSARYPVLWGLALRLGYDGTGYCSVRQLAEDVEAGERTVRRHLSWARDEGYLVRTRRGHRVDAKTALASEWRLTQPATGDPLGTDPTGQMEHPNRPDGAPQPASPAPPRGLSPIGLSSNSAPPAGSNGYSSASEAIDGMALEETRSQGVRGCVTCGQLSRRATRQPDQLCDHCSGNPHHVHDHMCPTQPATQEAT